MIILNFQKKMMVIWQYSLKKCGKIIKKQKILSIWLGPQRCHFFGKNEIFIEIGKLLRNSKIYFIFSTIY